MLYLGDGLSNNTVRQSLYSSITYSSFVCNKDTQVIASRIKLHRRQRSAISGRCITKKYGETIVSYSSITYSLVLFNTGTQDIGS